MRGQKYAPMSIGQSTALLFSFFSLCACASAPGDIESPSKPKAPIRGGIAEFKLSSFDGEIAKGRVLVGVTIRSNYWYGAQVRFVLFSKRRSKELPDCFKGDLMVWAQGAQLAATLPIQVSRTDNPSASTPQAAQL